MKNALVFVLFLTGMPVGRRGYPAPFYLVGGKILGITVGISKFISVRKFFC